MNIKIYSEDCISGATKHIKDGSVDLLICDPPFGINEKKFNKHYKRDDKHVIDGYVEAPKNYDEFTLNWMEEAWRILKPNGSMYIVSSWTNYDIVLKTIGKLKFHLLNEIIWKYNFGVFNKHKFISSHYPIAYVCKDKKNYTFNISCRFDNTELDENKNKKQYKDREDVWLINKENKPSEKKNCNKLPEELILKMILYSSNENDLVGDFFLGNFTTAVVSKKVGRNVVGFEINKNMVKEGLKKLELINWGQDLEKNRPKVDILPINQGKPISIHDKALIKSKFNELIKEGLTKKDAILKLGVEFGRGKFAIINIVGDDTIYENSILKKPISKDEIINTQQLLSEKMNFYQSTGHTEDQSRILSRKEVGMMMGRSPHESIRKTEKKRL